MNTNLNDKAMLIRLSISQWTARKFDKTVSENVAAQYNADKSAGRYNKVLVAESAIKAIQKTANEARTYHYENTLAWSDDDSRLLPAANYLKYSEKMRELKNNFEVEVDKFIDAYPTLVDDARARLNGMFNAADYPFQSEIKGKYRFGVSINPLLVSDDFRVTLSNDEINSIRADIEARTKEAQANALSDLWNRLYSAVSHMAGRLADTEAIFRDSLIENIVDLCELLPRLNVLDDKNLDAMKNAVESKLCGYKLKDLREDKEIRKSAVTDANDILAAMAGYMGN